MDESSVMSHRCVISFVIGGLLSVLLSCRQLLHDRNGQERLEALQGWEGGRALSVTFFAVLLVDLAMSLDAAYKNPVVVV